MSRAASTIIPKYPTEPVFPLTVDQYHDMIRVGVLTDDDPVELIEGVLVFHMPKNPIHEYAVHTCRDELQNLLSRDWVVRMQAPVTLSDGEPEPDLSVVHGTLRTYIARHPSPDDTAIVLEISDSTLSRDRGMKLRSYARAGIAEYWIINIESRQIEVYTQPDPTAAEPMYLNRKDYTEADAVPVMIEGRRVGEIGVKAVLP